MTYRLAASLSCSIIRHMLNARRASSAEFTSQYGSRDNTSFVTLVYQNVLGRVPDPGGLAFWTGHSGRATWTPATPDSP